MKIRYKRGQRKYEVIIAGCRREIIRDGKELWRGNFADEDFRQVFPTKKLAEKKAQPAKGMRIILRPKFNEKDCKGKYFREWRSFDGGELKEVIWRL